MVRRVEEKMLERLALGKPGKCGPNTVVERNEDGTLSVILYRTEIIRVDPKTKTAMLRNDGWQTVTTKSRLNAFLTMATDCPPIYQENYEWYVGSKKWTKTLFVRYNLDNAIV